MDCVVGTEASNRDAAASSFAIGFYGGLGDGESVATAYRWGRAAMRMEGIPDSDRPHLKVREGVDVNLLVLASEAD